MLQRTRLEEALKSAHHVSPSVTLEEKQMLAHMQFAAQCCTELLAQVNGCDTFEFGSITQSLIRWAAYASTGFVASRSRAGGPVRKQTLRCWEIRMPTTRSLHQTPSVRRESTPLQMTLTM